jgi:hypothetical protein
MSSFLDGIVNTLTFEVTILVKYVNWVDQNYERVGILCDAFGKF